MSKRKDETSIFEDLVYEAPPKIQEVTLRRVYVLPRSLVQKIHKYGYDNRHPSEVSAVRALLEAALGGNDA